MISLRKRNIYFGILLFVIVFLVIIIYIEPNNNKNEFIDPFIITILPADEPNLNITTFEYKLKPNVCGEFPAPLLGIMIITSYVGHDELRSAHRHAISQTKLKSLGLQRVFLIAEIPPKEKYITQNAIIDENNRFGDILQGNFLEAYRNLSYKHMMGLRWASHECRKLKFIIKIDDDTVFDLFHIVNYLENIPVSTVDKVFLAGYILDHKKPIRITANKWYVSHEEFSKDYYPDYLSGWLYITNPKTARMLLYQSNKEKPFWIDDTWITGILREKQGITLTRLNKWFSANSQFLDCCIEDLKKYSLKCDYHVGPNEGDRKMIIKFMEQMEVCYIDECVERSPNQMLSKTCVGKTKFLIGEHGDAFVNAVRL